MPVVSHADHLLFSIPSGSSLRDALGKIQELNGRACLVVTEQGKTEGVVSDGDIRRHLLKGGSLDSSVSGILKPFQWAVPEEGPRAIVRRMVEQKLEIMPIIDRNGLTSGVWLFENRSEVPHDTPALILAGGLGKRLLPITRKKPKPLVHIGGISLLERSIRTCMSFGFRRFYVSVNYLKDQVIQHLAEITPEDIEVIVLDEEEPLGTAGPIGKLPGDFGDEILLVNADVIHSVDLAGLMAHHRREKASISVVVRNHEQQIPFGVVDLDGTDIVDIAEKPAISVPVSTGIYMLSRSATSRVSLDRPLDMPDLIQLVIIQKERVSAFFSDGYWIDVGTPESLALADYSFGPGSNRE